MQSVHVSGWKVNDYKTRWINASVQQKNMEGTNQCQINYNEMNEKNRMITYINLLVIQSGKT